MTSEASASPRAIPLLAVAAVLVAALLAVLVAVLDKIGVPAGLLMGLVAGAGLLFVLVAAGSGGTMRLPVYLTAGRSLGGPSAGLALATALAVPAGPSAAAIQGVVLAFSTLWLGTALRRSGAASLSGFLAARFGGAALRTLAALLVGGAATVLGAASLARAIAALGEATSLKPVAATALIAALAITAVIPGGGLGVVRAAVAGGCLLLAASLAGLGSVAATGPILAERGGMLAVLTAWPPVGDVAVLVAATLAWPATSLPAAAVRDPRDLREAALFALAALVAMALARQALATVTAGGAALAAGRSCAALLAILPPFLAGIALLHAAGVALGYDLPGRRDRLKASTSRRFADLRLVMLMLLAAALWAASQRQADLLMLTPFAASALLAGLLPPVLLTLLRPAVGAGAGFAAVLAGLAAAALGADARAWPGGVQWLDPGLLGAMAGLSAGLALSLVVPRARPAPVPSDAAL